MAAMAKHSAAVDLGGSARVVPLRTSDRQERITVVADAMRGLVRFPGSAAAQQRYDAAVRGSSDDEREEAWAVVRREQERAAGEGPSEGAPGTPASVPEPPCEPPRARPSAALAARLGAVNGDTVITWAMTLAAAAVIAFAAVVSYSHIHGLATGHGEDSVQSHLLPLSIDGVIAEASLVMLFAARHKDIATPRLARVMLWAGIVATLAANAVVALPAAWFSPVANAVIGAVLSAWPAAAFIASVELVMRLVRDVRAVASARDAEAPSAGGAETSPAAAPQAAPAAAAGTPAEPVRKEPAKRPVTPSERPSRRGSAGREGVREGAREGVPVVPAKASDEDLAALIVPLLARGELMSQTRTAKVVREAAGGGTGIGPERAGRVLALARRIHSGEAAPGERQTA